MPEFNLTDAQKIMVGIAYSDGQKLGEKLSDAIKSGEFIIPDNQTMEIMLEEFINYDFVASQKLLAKIVSPNTYMVGNFLCAGGGVIIGGSSVINFYKTKNGLARTCYAISGICGGTAAIFGTYSGLTGYCGLSMFATGGDIIGGSFLWVGNKAKKLGNYVEGKKSWTPRLRNRNLARRPFFAKAKPGAYKGVSFITPRSVNVPFETFETILIIGGTIFTVYSYGKIMIAIYRYINKKFFPKIPLSATARGLIDSFNKSEYIKKRNRIYYTALRLDYS